jgi:hypothetical protein
VKSVVVSISKPVAFDIETTLSGMAALAQIGKRGIEKLRASVTARVMGGGNVSHISPTHLFEEKIGSTL